ncbi:universal stress protein [Kitasatospora mediocidica]|uniref:universal stress protein n=1 Tax=Kitasatospora mediocidica TaxID=58352 RepID=UPI000562099A|nr:universal stress protein [Kitasatospora mediocidica]
MDSGRRAGQCRVVVGVSGSLGSLAALHRAVAEARRTDAEVLAVLAWLPVGGEYGHRRAPCPPLMAVWREAAAARLNVALDDAFGGAPTGVRLSTVLIRGDSGPALVQTADRDGDLLVVGSGSGSMLARGLRRSVSAYCVKHADCPVLAVPKPPLHRELTAFRRRRLLHLPTEPAPSR